MVGEPAVHGGLILLQYPQNRKDIGFSTDYEVVKLKPRPTTATAS